jgi:hypothetical protein
MLRIINFLKVNNTVYECECAASIGKMIGEFFKKIHLGNFK